MDMRNDKAKARDKWMGSPEGVACREGVAQGQYLSNRLERAFCDGWEAALQNSGAVANEPPTAALRLGSLGPNPQGGLRNTAHVVHNLAVF